MFERQKLVARFAADFIQGRSYRTIVEARQQASIKLGQQTKPMTALAYAVGKRIEPSLLCTSKATVSHAVIIDEGDAIANAMGLPTELIEESKQQY